MSRTKIKILRSSVKVQTKRSNKNFSIKNFGSRTRKTSLRVSWDNFRLL